MENPSKNSRDEDWSPDQRHAYERESLRETREQLTRLVAAPSVQYELREIRLEGTYPDTAIVVCVWDRRVDKERTTRYPIWKLGVLRGSRGIRESPYTVGMLITTWSLGG
jgi:hypothetical protein